MGRELDGDLLEKTVPHALRSYLDQRLERMREGLQVLLLLGCQRHGEAARSARLRPTPLEISVVALAPSKAPGHVGTARLDWSRGSHVARNPGIRLRGSAGDSQAPREDRASGGVFARSRPRRSDLCCLPVWRSAARQTRYRLRHAAGSAS